MFDLEPQTAAADRIKPRARDVLDVFIGKGRERVVADPFANCFQLPWPATITTCAPGPCHFLVCHAL